MPRGHATAVMDTVAEPAAAGYTSPSAPTSGSTQQGIRVKVLFVCFGNICRSPTAEAVLRAHAARDAPELTLEVDSAGTAGYHIGEPPDPRTRQAAARRGYD